MERNYYFDYLRAIAIFMVVAIHCFNNDCHNEWLYFVRNTLNCAVPLFLAISGFFLGRKDLSSKQKYIGFLKKQVPKVYIPMLVWSLPFLLISIFAGKCTGGKLVLYFVGGLGVFYFIALILQYYCLLPVIKKVLARIGFGGVIITFLISEISAVLITYYKIVLGLKIPLIIYAGLFPLFMVCYVAGVYLGIYSKRTYSIWIPLLFVIIGLVLSQLETIYLCDNFGAGFGVKPSSIVYSLAMIFFMMSSCVENLIKKIVGKSDSLLIYIGNISFGIYLVHFLIVKKMAVRITDSWFLKWCFTLIISILLLWVLIRLIPKKYHKYIGI